VVFLKLKGDNLYSLICFIFHVLFYFLIFAKTLNYCVPFAHMKLVYYLHFAKDHFYFWAYVKINILFGLY